MDLLTRIEKWLAEEVRPYAWGLVILALLTLLAMAPMAFTTLLASDDWKAVTQPLTYSDWVVSIGRWGMRLQWDLLPFHAYERSYTVLGNALASLLLGIWAARFIGFSNRWAVTMFTGMFVLAPVWIDWNLYALGQFFRFWALLFPAVMAWAVLRFCEIENLRLRDYRYFATSVLAFVLAASFNQVSVLIGIELIAAGVLLRLSEAPGPNPAGHVWQYYFARPLTAVLAGLVLYILSIGFFQWLYSIEPTTVLSYSPSLLTESLLVSPFQRLGYVVDAMEQFYFHDMHLVPAIFGWGIIAGVLFFLMNLLRHRPTRGTPQAGQWTYLVLLLAGMLALPFAFGLVRQLDTRVIAPTVILFAFFLSYPLQSLDPGRLRSAFTAFAFFLLLLSGYQFSAAGTVKQLNNRLDLHMTEKLIERIRHHPSLSEQPDSKPLRMLFVGLADFGKGPPLALPTADEPFANSFINCGLFNCKPLDFQHAALLYGFRRKLDIELLTPEEAGAWLRAYRPDVFEPGRPLLRDWWSHPAEGFLVGTNNEVMVLLEDVRLGSSDEG